MKKYVLQLRIIQWKFIEKSYFSVTNKDRNMVYFK